MSKIILKFLVGLTLIPAFSLAATTVKPKKMTCNEFVGLDEAIQPKVVYFIEGATNKGKPEDAMIAVDEVSSPVLWVLDECKKTPSASVWQKVEHWVASKTKKL